MNIFGDPAVERFSRDVLQRPNVHTLLILLGTNDISLVGAYASAATVDAGLQTLAQRAHAAGIHKVFVATLTPRSDTGYMGGLAVFPITQQPQLTALNAMIRTSTDFDGFIEFHDPMEDPSNAEDLNPAYDSGDGLHPNAAGHLVMSQQVPLAVVR